jgi:hypothetical protein
MSKVKRIPTRGVMGVRAVKEVLAACVCAGQSEEDISSAIKHLERVGGVTVASRNRS